MGGYLLLNLEFKDKNSRDIFEKEFKLKRNFQYKQDKYDGSDRIECFYIPSWMGYAEPNEMKKKFKKLGIKVNKFLSLDVSTNSSWYDEINQSSLEVELE